jgi:nucleoside recognition membrane protein YjiH
VNAEKSGPIARFILFSALGAISFFVPIGIGDRSTIVIDHLVTLITDKATIFANSAALFAQISG